MSQGSDLRRVPSRSLVGAGSAHVGYLTTPINRRAGVSIVPSTQGVT